MESKTEKILGLISSLPVGTPVINKDIYTVVGCAPQAVNTTIDGMKCVEQSTNIIIPRNCPDCRYKKASRNRMAVCPNSEVK